MNGDEKKERVIHTRVPESLDRELRDKAQSLGVSVSNLVRNVLSNAFELVDEVVADSAAVARSARGGRRRTPASPEPDEPGEPAPVIGYQPVILNLNAVCSDCNAILPRGTDASVGLTDGPGPRPILCARCLERLRHE